MRRKELIKAVILPVIVLICMTSCKEPYYPDVDKSGAYYLVVEGTIFNGDNKTVIKLSRTADLKDTKVKGEAKAILTVEDEDNSKFGLAEEENGVYSATLTNLQVDKKYRLRIKTSNGKEYLSDFVALKNTPEIDSVTWAKNADGVSISVNAHDDENRGRYYRWLYEQTWEFHSPYISNYDYEEPFIIDRINSNDIFQCWKSQSSSTVIIKSTVNLSKDQVDHYQLLNIPMNSWYLSVLYSVLVKQYVMTQEEYQYWQKIKKNTEELGSIFDPQPSEIPGNIHCVSDKDEVVIGYVGACVPRERRIFISNAQVQPWRYRPDCFTVDVLDNPDSLKAAFHGGQVDPVGKYFRDGQTRYTGASVTCIDCTLSGTNKKPSFWP
ncbi:uncharacterized protein DUF4249 [Arcticibacter tournemirensis]|uniref:DUF4249 domain-containing protein n=1 Tax=Arcticibacter tournemirensis TaxID=699437 RepID=A0A5M9H054_9SPHI|nr:DUF4249 domain-containing protein [Arcticibacter tournemirensis]KAA8478438.1 DUF4249 domain-containing protein [Arcticibacter tournemirensis]TQM48571.1 uncharacterized protein DUF4249 [Arcticibacter tournemirensis]